MRAISDTISILRIVIPAIFFGLLISNYMYSIPVFRKLVELISSLTSRFGMKSGTAVAAFLIHPVVAYTILSELHRDGVIDDREAVIAVLVGTFPRTLRLVMVFLIPIAIPTLGVWGIYYILLILLTRGAISVFGILIARRTLNGKRELNLEIPEIGLKDTLKRFARISLTLSITVFSVMFVFDLGFLKYLESFASGLSAFGLPPASVVVVATGFPSMLAAIATAGSLLSKNLLSGKALLISLFLASICHSFVEVSRNTFPVAASIMGKSLGLRVATVVLISRIAANILALLILVIF